MTFAAIRQESRMTLLGCVPQLAASRPAIGRVPIRDPCPGRSTAMASCPAASSASTWARYIVAEVRSPCTSTTLKVIV
jgi:hypothetical protein